MTAGTRRNIKDDGGDWEMRKMVGFVHGLEVWKHSEHLESFSHHQPGFLYNGANMHSYKGD